MSRTAIVLLNLGGPDSAAAVEPFLFNLFNDRAIIDLRQPLRWAVARLIAHRRGPVARQIYAHLGNRSPLLDNTRAQARALGDALGPDCGLFIAMRYWHPLSAATAAAVKAWQPDRIVLLPLYPQFSTTTTKSSVAEWQRAAKAVGLAVPTRSICCYPDEEGFITAAARVLRDALAAWPTAVPLRVLLSAHGLPQRIVARGDPYQWQVEATAAALRRELALPGLDCTICYQSRVGPLAWLAPATDAEIRRAGAEKTGLIILPIAFVSEHSETLVELDIEYRHLAEQAEVPRYLRLPTVGTAPEFIAGLARLVAAAQESDGEPYPAGGQRRCPATSGLCPCAVAAA